MTQVYTLEGQATASYAIASKMSLMLLHALNCRVLVEMVDLSLVCPTHSSKANKNN
jgi:hypothetical protein